MFVLHASSFMKTSFFYCMYIRWVLTYCFYMLHIFLNSLVCIYFIFFSSCFSWSLLQVMYFLWVARLPFFFFSFLFIWYFLFSFHHFSSCKFLNRLMIIPYYCSCKWLYWLLLCIAKRALLGWYALNVCLQPLKKILKLSMMWRVEIAKNRRFWPKLR